MSNHNRLDLIKVKKSKIHHKGIFAKKDIPEGTKILEYTGRKITKKESDKVAEETLKKNEEDSDHGEVYIFELNDKYDIDGNTDYNIAKYVNHSCDPNCEVEIKNGRIWITTIKGIKKGEEISYNYGYDLYVCEDYPCNCGSKRCIGYILNEEDWSKLKKRLAKRKN